MFHSMVVGFGYLVMTGIFTGHLKGLKPFTCGSHWPISTYHSQNQVTVLNIETGHISGVAYSGTLVRGIEHYGRKLFHSNSALQVCLQSIIVALGLKVYLLYHLMGVTNRTTGEILKGLGVAKGDWDIIMYLTGMIQRQEKKRLESS